METDNNLTERELYIKGLEAKISKAGRAKQFIGSEAGALITELLQEEINAIVKRIGGRKYLDDQKGYAYELGGLHLAQRILNVLNNEARTDTEPLKEKLKEAKES